MVLRSLTTDERKAIASAQQCCNRWSLLTVPRTPKTVHPDVACIKQTQRSRTTGEVFAVMQHCWDRFSGDSINGKLFICLDRQHQQQSHRTMKSFSNESEIITYTQDGMTYVQKVERSCWTQAFLFLFFFSPKQLLLEGGAKKSHTVMVWRPAHLQNQKLPSLLEGLTKSTFKDGQSTI